ncbi:MAG: hypothetical protein ACR2KB_07125 [Chitinophagaceae bacterium]|nr:hypothetical protein [Flavisolibacter sp.]
MKNLFRLTRKEGKMPSQSADAIKSIQALVSKNFPFLSEHEQKILIVECLLELGFEKQYLRKQILESA